MFSCWCIRLLNSKEYDNYVDTNDDDNVYDCDNHELGNKNSDFCGGDNYEDEFDDYGAGVDEDNDDNYDGDNNASFDNDNVAVGIIIATFSGYFFFLKLVASETKWMQRLVKDLSALKGLLTDAIFFS